MLFSYLSAGRHFSIFAGKVVSFATRSGKGNFFRSRMVSGMKTGKAIFHEGPVVQRIVCRFPEPKIEVRFLSGLLKNKGCKHVLAAFSFLDDNRGNKFPLFWKGMETLLYQFYPNFYSFFWRRGRSDFNFAR